MREGFDRLSRLTGSQALVQYNPVGDETLIAHLYSARQAAMGNQDCDSAFGGDRERCEKAYPYVAAVFNSPEIVRSWNLDRFCDEYQINVLVATDVDPAWQDRYGWVWTRQALLTNPSVRAISCGTAPLAPTAR
jgi:hypothetical protein